MYINKLKKDEKVRKVVTQERVLDFNWDHSSANKPFNAGLFLRMARNAPHHLQASKKV
jgi:hypothetical protein